MSDSQELSLLVPESLTENINARVEAIQPFLSALSTEQKLKFSKTLVISDYVFKQAQQNADLIKLLASSSSSIDWLAEEQALNQLLSSASNDQDVKRILRQWRHRFFTGFTHARINQLITIEQECADISAAAEILVRQSYQWVFTRHISTWGEPLDSDGSIQNLIILAMGKFGGAELNFSSDIDLIFLYPSDGETQNGPRKIEHQVFFTRLGQQLIQLLADKTGHGFVFRVDMRLRPYGDSGALAISYAAAEEYYQDQGREWERFAMIKAKAITGTEQEQKQFYQLIKPFVFRRYIDFGVLESIRDMKSLIEKEVRRKSLNDNIKLGSGGIREAEFIAQSLQIIRGGRLPQLQVKSFSEAVVQLVECEMLDQHKAKYLVEAYWFLRQVEHLIQQIDDQQSQQLPENELDQWRIATALNFSDYASLLKAVNQQREVIAKEFKEVFRLQQESETSAASFNLNHLDEGDLKHLFEQDVEEAFQNFVMKELDQFVESVNFQQLSAKGKARLELLVPKLIAGVSECENPQATFGRILNLLKAINRRTAYLVLLAENPPILNQLIRLCSQSQWIGQLIAQHPVLLDELLYANNLYHPDSGDELIAQLREQMLRIEPDDEEQQQEQLRFFKQTNELRVAAAVLNGSINVRKASRYLSDIANAVIDSVLQLSWRKLCQRHGTPLVADATSEQCRGFSVIGYGKLGGEELGFGSDLDLVFIYEAEADALTSGDKAISNGQFFTRLAQRIISSLNIRTLGGVLYEVDMRLRPSGNSGLLVSHKNAFQEYQQKEAWTWEHQALTRSRCVAGDKNLCAWFEQVRNQIIAIPRNDQKLKQEVIAMREKMRANLDKSNQEYFDIKQGQGGMVDIEFLAQYWVLKCASEMPEVAWPSRTTRQFILLAEHGRIERGIVEQLLEAYRQYRELSNFQVLKGESSLVERMKVSSLVSEVNAIWQQWMS